jgi:hypothetical protein
MTPAAKPRRASNSRADSSRVKRTGRAPRPVARPVANVARKPTKIGEARIVGKVILQVVV